MVSVYTVCAKGDDVMRLIAIFMFSIALTACAGSGATVREHATLTAAQQNAVESTVRQSLKDPESARFSNITAGRSADGFTVCGQVNAKNSYGGYTGPARFYGTLSGDNFRLVQLDDTNAGGSRWASNLCAQVGLISWAPF